MNLCTCGHGFAGHNPPGGCGHVINNGSYCPCMSFVASTPHNAASVSSEALNETQSFTDGFCDTCNHTAQSVVHQIHCEAEQDSVSSTTTTSEIAKQSYTTKAVNAENTTSDVVSCSCPMAPGFGGILHVQGCSLQNKKVQ